MTETIEVLIKKFQEGIEEAESRAKILKTLPFFGSLMEYPARFRHYLCSKEVNEICDDFELAWSCGCCEDPRLIISPFTTAGTKYRIYSYPPQIFLGMRNSPDSGPKVRKKLDEYKINYSIIDRWLDRKLKEFRDGHA